MSIVPTVVISQVAHGAAKAEYDGTSEDWYTTAYKGDGYYGYTDGLHTVSYQTTNFVGQIGVQASLATNPGENDWFDIVDTQIGDAADPLTDNTYANFSGNFVWIRIAVTSFTGGTINLVLYN
jgi:hypothetical protein